MKKKIKLVIANLILSLLVTVVFTGCGSNSPHKEYVLTTAFQADEVLRINNKSCFLPEMMLYLTTVQNEYEDVYSEEIWKYDYEGRTLTERIKDMVLAKVAKIKVMNIMAESYGIELDDAQIQRIEGAATSFFSSLTSTEIKAMGITYEDVKNVYSEYALANKVYDYVIKDIDSEISDDEARTIRVMHILIKTYSEDADGSRVEFTDIQKKEAYERAVEIRNQLVDEEKPADFESLAAKYNEDETTSYSFGRNQMNSVFEEAAFSLDEGAISEIVETEYGYHIIKCVSVFDIDQTQANKVKILEQRKNELFEKTYDDFVKTLTKNLNKSLFDAIELIDDPEVTTKNLFDVTL